MVIVLGDGEENSRHDRVYDKSCIKVNRNGQSNLLIYKPAIKYMYKEGRTAGSSFQLQALDPFVAFQNCSMPSRAFPAFGYVSL